MASVLYVTSVVFVLACLNCCYGQDENQYDAKLYKRCYACYHSKHNQLDASYDFEMQFQYTERYIKTMVGAGQFKFDDVCKPNITRLPSRLEKNCPRDWYCVKELVELSPENYIVARFCRTECRERWMIKADGSHIYRKCCVDDVCNKADDVTGHGLSVVLGLIVCLVTTAIVADRK